MTSALKPIYLLAESQILFSSANGTALARRIRDAIDRERPTAAYVGAANGDQPAYFSIFEAAMDIAGVEDRRMVRASFPSPDAAFLESADIILLAGGDAGSGWSALEAAGMTHVLRDRYGAGAVLIGVSAGAMLLGESAWTDDDAECVQTFDALGLVPWIVDTRDEANDWRRLRRAMAAGGRARGLGLPARSAVACHADLSLEPIGRSVVELFAGDGGDAQTLLIPSPGDD